MNSDISDFEDPSSYDLFIRAVTNGTGAVNATLNFVNEALDSALKLFSDFMALSSNRSNPFLYSLCFR